MCLKLFVMEEDEGDLFMWLYSYQLCVCVYCETQWFIEDKEWERAAVELSGLRRVVQMINGESAEAS